MSENTDSGKGDITPPSSTTGRRRSSLAELFAARPTLESASSWSGSPRAPGASMASALSQAQQQTRTRRLSITTLGLSGSPTHGQQTSPFGTLRRGSNANDAARPGFDENESAIDDTDVVPASSTGNTGEGDGIPRGESIGRGGGPMSPFGRRFSFGARAYGDARVSSSGGGVDKSPPEGGTSGGVASGGSSSPNGGVASKGTSPPGIKGKDGYSWSDTLRSRAERSSISAGVPSLGAPLSNSHNRASSAAAAAVPAPAPAPKPVPKVPDHFQERILKGDFYMD